MIINFKEYLEVQKFGTLNVFDIDDTLFHTTAKISVIKDGKPVKELSNQEFNTYKLQPGESFDFSQFRDSDKFYHESKPISRMLDKASIILKNSESNPLSKVVIVTARANFNDKHKFLDTFRKHRFDIDKVRVERAGNINDVHDVAFKKVIIIRNYINTNMFNKVRLFDDSMANLKAFLKLKTEFPNIQFEAYFAKADGTIKTVK
jgi:hypothetical protein